MRKAGTAAKPTLHWFAAPLKLRGILAVARHECSSLHPRATILALMAVVNADAVAGYQRLHLRHFPQKARPRILDYPRYRVLVAYSNDLAAAPDNGIALLGCVNV